MDYKGLNNVDLEFFLLSGSSIRTGNLEIIPYTLREITHYGYTRYMSSLQFLSYSVDDFINSISDKNKKEYLQSQMESLKTFDFYMKFGGQEMQDYLLSVIAMILKTDDVRIIDNEIAINFLKLGILKKDNEGKIIINEECDYDTSEENLLLVNRNNFDDIIKIVRLQNYLLKLEEDEEVEDDLSGIDEATKKLILKQRELDKKVELLNKKKLKDSGEDINITDIVDAVTSKSNSINKLNVWDLTLYQLYKEYARLELIDNRDFAIRAVMAGAGKDIQISHWSSKI